MNKPVVQFGSVSVGDVPRLVGIVSSLDQADSLFSGDRPPCDLIELRLDRIGVDTDDWLECGKAVEAQGFPVIATLRIGEEGGNWTGPDTARRSVFLNALEHLSAIDIELRSALLSELAEHVERRERGLIVSHHDFKKTPQEADLEEVIRRASVNNHTVVKIAAHIERENDIARLKSLFSRERSLPLCIIGMGEAGTPTRVEFPKLGSCLAYGHLGESTAPGQLPLTELAARIRR